MRLRLLFLPVALLGGAILGWVTAPQTQPPSQARAAIAPELRHAGIDAQAARERLLALGYGGAPAAAEEILAPPPPPDIAVLLRRDLTAIEQRQDGVRVWIVDLTRDFGRRALRVGDVYLDGWRVSRIGAQTIELRRRRETRRVAVFDLPREDQP